MESGNLSPLGGSEEHDPLCAICNTGYKQPRLLACLHTYCEACLESTLEKQAAANKSSAGKHELECPECGHKTKIAGRGVVDSCPLEHVMVNELDRVALENLSMVCTSCKAKETAVARCNDCASFLCNNCVTAHRYMRCFESHAVVTFEELGGAPDPEQMAQVPICNECTLGEHKPPDHECERASEAGTKQREELTTLLTESKNHLQSFEESLELLQNGLTDLQQQRDTAKTIIQREHVSSRRTALSTWMFSLSDLAVAAVAIAEETSSFSAPSLRSHDSCEEDEEEVSLVASLGNKGLVVDIGSYVTVDEDVPTCREDTLDTLIDEVLEVPSEVTSEDDEDASMGPAPETFEKYKSFLERRQEQLLEELESLHSEEELHIMDSLHLAEKTTEHIEEACNFGKRLLEHANDVVSARLRSLIADTPKLEAPGEMAFEFDIERFEKALPSLCGQLRRPRTASVPSPPPPPAQQAPLSASPTPSSSPVGCLGGNTSSSPIHSASSSIGGGNVSPLHSAASSLVGGVSSAPMVVGCASMSPIHASASLGAAGGDSLSPPLHHSGAPSLEDAAAAGDPFAALSAAAPLEVGLLTSAAAQYNLARLANMAESPDDTESSDGTVTMADLLLDPSLGVSAAEQNVLNNLTALAKLGSVSLNNAGSV
ncbi:hypothetical protein HPB52_023930 [Rhipicephalus sanguineus]|uniref:Uncharacterized protein n=1 Tax=Rhipicephalus sanguineus TaxID=34632 RepID=A0A9D4Q8C7_RHISA|nr:hypothetical protein HPB52_023930 [Rhipicephalus sanguineus]